MRITDIIRSKAFLVTVFALFGSSIVIGAFGIGQLVGYRQARFSYAWSDQYDQNFGGPRRGIFGIPDEAVFPNPYGADGTVIKTANGVLLISGRDHREKAIVVDAQTQVRSFDPKFIENAAPGVGTHVVIIGDPNAQGQIVAKFIRILP